MPVTLPMPMQRDIEIARIIGNLSDNSGNGSNITSSIHVVEPRAWMYTSNDILYITFPIILIWGILTGLISILILIRQMRVSNDTYLLGYVAAAIALLTCGTILRTQDYVGSYNTYQYMYVYMRTLNDWLWYTSIWLLIVMTLERSMTVTHHRPKSLCSILQALAVTIMVFCVCLVSAMPQFWEYEVVETFDYGTNQTLVLSQTSEVADSPEYKIMYFWYTITITIFLPYPILFLLIFLLSRSMRHSTYHQRRLSVKHSTGNILKRKVTEEIHLTRMFIVLIILYFLFTGPLTFLRLVDRIFPQWGWESEIYSGLHNLFEFAFYFYYSILFLLFCSYSDRFRYSLLRTCCCCCKSEWHPVQRG